MQYAENQELYDTRTGELVTIDLVVKQPQGYLYTVKYDENKYRRYYEYRMNKIFAAVTNETQKPSYNPQDYVNVTFLDFANRSKFADLKSWLAWLGG